MRLLTLNVASPTRQRATELLGWLWPLEADVLVLTETGPGEGSRLLAQVCRAAGMQVHQTRPPVNGRGLLVAVAPGAGGSSRETLPGPDLMPERVLPLRVGELSVLAVYGAASDPVRYSGAAQRQRKREWLGGFERWLPGWAAAAPGERVLIGDLNLAEPLAGPSVGGTGAPALRYVLPEEVALLGALSDRHALMDAYRLRQPASTEVSWVDHSGAGCRYDHAFVSAGLTEAVGRCELLAAPREAGWTDHSALLLDLDVAPDREVG